MSCLGCSWTLGLLPNLVWNPPTPDAAQHREPVVVGTFPGQDRLFPPGWAGAFKLLFRPGWELGGAAAAAGSGSALSPTRLVPMSKLRLQVVSRKLRKRKQTSICTRRRVSRYDVTLLRWRPQAVPSSSEKTVLARALKS